MYKELNAIKVRIPQQTYRTIIGQMRAGDLGKKQHWGLTI